MSHWGLGVQTGAAVATPSPRPLQRPCSHPSYAHAAAPSPGRGFACVAHCFQNEITPSHGENKSSWLYRQISLKVFEEDSQGTSFVDDIGGKYEHQYMGFFRFFLCATHLFN